MKQVPPQLQQSIPLYPSSSPLHHCNHFHLINSPAIPNYFPLQKSNIKLSHVLQLQFLQQLAQLLLAVLVHLGDQLAGRLGLLEGGGRGQHLRLGRIPLEVVVVVDFDLRRLETGCQGRCPAGPGRLLRSGSGLKYNNTTNKKLAY
jgi:hypothetical protein